VFLKVVNADLERPQTARISVRGAAVSSSATIERVVADSLTAVNGFATPDAVKITARPSGQETAFRSTCPGTRLPSSR